jgi:hypothetical protein
MPLAALVPRTHQLGPLIAPVWRRFGIGNVVRVVVLGRGSGQPGAVAFRLRRSSPAQGGRGEPRDVRPASFVGGALYRLFGPTCGRSGASTG